MPTQYEDDDDEFDTEQSQDESALVKDLRKQLRASNKKVTELEAQVSEQGKGLRERTVKDILAAKEVRPGVAKFIPESVTDEAGVTAWLEENAEDLGITLGTGDAGDDEPDPELDERARAQQLSQRSGTPKTMQAAMAKISAATSDEEFDAAMREVQALTV